MEPAFWHERWLKGDIGFHQSRHHPALERFWALTGAQPGARVFVPLCGKSLDMHWLGAAGHAIVGVELSAIAIRDFFTEARLPARVDTLEPFDIAIAGPYEIWCGDLFELPSRALAGIAAVYDRASLIALPPDMRARYARWLADHLAPATRVLLVTLDYDQREMSGPPFSVPPAEVAALFGAAFHIEELVRQDALGPADGLRKRGLTAATETVSLLTRLGADP
ncbi:MAG: thiopurine S-methyltransferase [Hyphomicrobiaceae bacterium]|nr:thiopurine S-methyltransferase [Hyphomicrobiaceae bacterium]